MKQHSKLKEIYLNDELVIWPWFDREINVHCDNKVLLKKILKIVDSKRRAVYKYPKGELKYDVILMKKDKQRALKILKKHYGSL